ncbi:Growth arrest and DNA damage-inducible protein GADD45 alpha [Galemys pyrenaicus]|uniref:Growth arrest and DNA damage-inducible protein GADD45 alpha n=1 Tax=Galemys pyrenaicus TaxID=202257 RepID=A0A8J5ZPA2_GALPY|nr:Growth arrest and DNA damage-inducible protein GADD45 alpha [Galemys pyrenaicus]
MDILIRWMDKVGDALEEVLSKALSQRTITVGVYEAAKLLNVDPDNVVLCLLAADEDDDRDVALQIHFTLIQAFCCENDINILRVSNPGRLAELLLLEPNASPAASEGAQQPPDLHCVLVTVREGDWSPARKCTRAKCRLPADLERAGVKSMATWRVLLDFQPRCASFIIGIFSGTEHV